MAGEDQQTGFPAPAPRSEKARREGNGEKRVPALCESSPPRREGWCHCCRGKQRELIRAEYAARMAGDMKRVDPVLAVKQAALTSAAMGVDFVPRYRSRAGSGAGATDADGSEAGDGGALAGGNRGGGAELITPARTDWHLVDARRAAAHAALEEVRARYERDAPHRKFTTAHTNIVFGEGDPGARLMFIGEAPGADEDRAGRPFVGRSGQLLARMMLAMGFARHEVYIANVLKTRPPGNATPTLEEAALCAPYLHDQIAAVRPEVIVTLGLPAARVMLGTDESMGRLRGTFRKWTHPKDPSVTAQLMPTFHPAFILRQYTQENRNKVWSDLKMVMDLLGMEGKKK